MRPNLRGARSENAATAQVPSHPVRGSGPVDCAPDDPPARGCATLQSSRVTTVSTIIPTFNRSSLLVKAIESALEQTYPNQEIIVVDDGSTDDTFAAVTPYLDRIRYVYQDHQGVAVALNKGIEVATGQWIAVLASDDLWLPTKLEEQAKALTELGEGFDACFTNCSYMGNPALVLTTFEEAQIDCQSDFQPLEEPHNYILAKSPALFVQSMLASRSLLQKIDGFDRDLVVGEDADLLFRLAFHTRFCVVQKPLVKIDRTPDQPRLTNLYDSNRDLGIECMERRYKKMLELPELTDETIRQRIEELLRALYYEQMVGSLYRFDLERVFSGIRQLRETGLSLPGVLVTTLSRGAKKFFSTLTSKNKRKSAQDVSSSSSQHILKSTAFIGGSNGFVAVMRIAQVKVFAVLLGPAGIGLMGLYSSVLNTAATIGGFGVSSSGVREIGKASGSPDGRESAVARIALRRVTLLLGVIASLTTFLLRRFFSGWVFGTERYASAVGVLSVGVLCTIVSSSQVAVLNGLRRLKDIVRVNLLGSVIGTSATILIVVLWRDRGLAYAVVATTLITLLCSWWFVWRIPLPAAPRERGELRGVSLSLLRLGAAFLVASVTASVVLLLTRVIIVNRIGMASAGYFQAAWGFVVFYIDFILNAMGVDFYPHLASRVQDDKAANQLVNEQTEVALLLGGPLILGMMLFAPLLIHLFYSSQFTAATELLRWLLLGHILKILSWPMGYLLMARGMAKAFVFVEVVWASSYLGVLYWGIEHGGIYAAGWAFVASYVAYSAVLYFIVNRAGGFRWTSLNLIFGTILSLSAVLILVLIQHTRLFGYLFGGLVVLVAGILCLMRLYRLVEDHAALRVLNRVTSKVAALFA